MKYRNFSITILGLGFLEFGFDSIGVILNADDNNQYFIEIDMNYEKPSGNTTIYINIDKSLPIEEKCKIILTELKKYNSPDITEKKRSKLIFDKHFYNAWKILKQIERESYNSINIPYNIFKNIYQQIN